MPEDDIQRKWNESYQRRKSDCILVINSKHVNVHTVMAQFHIWINNLKIEINAIYLGILYLILISTEMDLRLFKQTKYLSEIREAWGIPEIELQSSKSTQEAIFKTIVYSVASTFV